MVIVSKDDKRKVYLHLLSEGVMVVKKDFKQEFHQEVKVPNLHVWMLLRSLADKSLVEVIFNWQWLYYYVKDEGVTYLKEQLGITESLVVPDTFKKSSNDSNVIGKDESEERQERRYQGKGRFGSGRGGNRFGAGRGATRGGDQEQQTPAQEGEQQQQE